MPSALDRSKVRKHLGNFDLRPLFIEELGWDHGGGNTEVAIADRSFALKAVAHKRGMVAYQYVADSDAALPDHPTRQKIERAVAKTVREHVIVYATHDRTAQYWQWVKREPGRPDRSRLHIYRLDQPGEALSQKLEHLVFAPGEEDDLTIIDVSRPGFARLSTWKGSPRDTTTASRRSTTPSSASSTASRLRPTGSGTRL